MCLRALLHHASPFQTIFHSVQPIQVKTIHCACLYLRKAVFFSSQVHTIYVDYLISD